MIHNRDFYPADQQCTLEIDIATQLKFIINLKLQSAYKSHYSIETALVRVQNDELYVVMSASDTFPSDFNYFYLQKWRYL